jgi:hypothetical protein
MGLSTRTATIASSGTTSSVVRNVSGTARSFILPTMTGTAISFTVCDTYGGTYVAVEAAAGTAISVTSESSKAYAIPAEVQNFPFFKFVSGSTEAASRTIKVIFNSN